MNKEDWGGVFPAVTTKFKENGDIDLEASAKHIEILIKAGVHGMVVCGTVGEGGSLTYSEKIDLVGKAAEVCRDQVPLLIGVAETTTRQAIQLTQDAQKAGADGIMLLPGMQYTSDRKETLHHFRTVARETDLPVMIYNNPPAYNVDTTPDMFTALADQMNIVAVKESSGDIRRTTDIIRRTGDRYRMFVGIDDLAVEGFAAGADGWVAGLVCAFPKETLLLYDLLQADRMDDACYVYEWFLPLLQLDTSAKLVQNIKLAETMVGLGNENVRAPRLPLSGDEREEVTGIIQNALDSRSQLDQLFSEETV